MKDLEDSLFDHDDKFYKELKKRGIKPKETPFCKDCKWSRAKMPSRFICWVSGQDYPAWAECVHPKSFPIADGEIDLVTGRVKQEEKFASVARLSHRACGPNANLFESKR